MKQFQKKEAAYLRLYRVLREGIISGVYPFGTKLPSKRTIAAENGVSTVTAEHAYALLTDEGYIEPRERSGYFVSFRVGDHFAAAPLPRRTGPALSAPSASGGTQFPISVLTRTMRRVMADKGEGILQRTEGNGCAELRTAIARYLRRGRGIQADEKQIIIGSGAEYLYGMIVKLLGNGRIYGVESPSYNKIAQVYGAEGVKIELLPLGHDGIESHALQSTSAQILHLTPYRSFPSGVSASASKRHEYLRWAGKDGRYLIEDDFESEFSVSGKPEETLFGSTAADNVIFVNTFSMTVSPAMRAAYMVLPKHLVASFEEKLGFYACTVPTFEQLVLTELIENGDFERQINRVRRAKRREMKQQ